MAKMSGFVADLLAANGALDELIPKVREFSGALGEVQQNRLQPSIASPTAPQLPGGPGGVAGGAGADVQGPDGGINLRNRTAAATLGGAPAPQAGAGGPISGGPGVGSASPLSTSQAGAAGAGGRTTPAQYGVWAHLVDGRLFPAYPPGDPAAVGAKVGPASYTPPTLPGQTPVTYKLDGYDCSFALGWPEATRLVYWRVPDRGEIGKRVSSSSGGGASAGGSNPAGARDLRANPKVGGGGYVDVPTFLANTTGKSSATMSTGESAIVGALGAVTSELRAIRKENAGAGIQLRAGGAV